MIGAARMMPITLSQSTFCHTPTAKSSNPTKPGSENRRMMGEIANGARSRLLVLSDSGIRTQPNVRNHRAATSDCLCENARLRGSAARNPLTRNIVARTFQISP